MANVLTIIPYSFYPPIGGGALRCFYILEAMSRKHNLYVLTSQPLQEFNIDFNSPFPENVKIISTYKSKRYHSILNVFPERLADALNYRLLKKTLKGPTDTSLLDVYPTLIALLNDIKFDLVLFENLEALALFGSFIKKMSPSSLKLYDAHNVDSELWMQQAVSQNKLVFKNYAKKALSIEKQLYKLVNAYLCCSEGDMAKLSLLNNYKIKGWLIPNGVDLSARPFDSNPQKFRISKIVFCGSLDYHPNKEGLIWFYINVFPIIKEKLPNVMLTVIGTVKNLKDYQLLINDQSVHFVGRVESVVPYYQQSSIAIVPLLSGSGTRLKILEAMSMGNPIVSTSIGAEGLDYKNGEHLMIADTVKEFAQHTVTLLSVHSKFDEIRLNALKLVKSNYNWSKIGEKLNYSLELMNIKPK